MSNTIPHPSTLFHVPPSSLLIHFLHILRILLSFSQSFICISTISDPTFHSFDKTSFTSKPTKPNRTPAQSTMNPDKHRPVGFDNISFISRRYTLHANLANSYPKRMFPHRFLKKKKRISDPHFFFYSSTTTFFFNLRQKKNLTNTTTRQR